MCNMPPAPNDEIYPTGAHVPGRSARLLKAELELMASTPMVWMRLAGGVILGGSLTIMGVYFGLAILAPFFGREFRIDASWLGAMGISVVCFLLSAVVFTAVLRTVQAYRRNGLI
jgi:hypothetical protein